MTTEKTITSPNGEEKVKDLIQSDRFRAAVQASLPSHLKPDRFVRVALTALTRTPKLAQCDQMSLFQCLLTLSQLGLEPDGRNAHLIPFENRKRGVVECQLIVDYKGLCDLAMRSGSVAYIHADKICQNDVFEYDRGEIKKHQVNFKVPRGDAYAYYAICRFKDGAEKCEVMTKEDVDKIRARSRAKDSGPWVTDYDEMAKKTVFRRLSKWLQLSPEYRDALEADADTLEEHRFESALPVTAIERPRIANVAPPTQEPEPDKPKRGRKSKAEPESPPLAEALPKVSEKAAELERRLKTGGYSVIDLLVVAIKRKIIEAPQGWNGDEKDLADVPLASVGEEKLTRFLDNWDVLAELIDADRAPKPAAPSEPVETLFR